MSDPIPATEPRRCPHCDAVVRPGATRCLLCGKPLPKQPAAPSPTSALPTPQPEPVAPLPLPEPIAAAPIPPVEVPSVVVETPPVTPEPAPAPVIEPAVVPEVEVEAEPQTVEPAPQPSKAPPPPPAVIPPLPVASDRNVKPLRPLAGPANQRRSLWLNALFGLVLLLVVIVAVFVIPYPTVQGEETPIAAAANPTVPVIPTFTPTITLIPTETTAATSEPTATQTPAPTATLQPPQTHIVQEGETLYTLCIRYNVTANIIAELNGLQGDNPNIIVN